MKLLENVALKDYATMRLGGPARYFAVAKSREDIAEAAKWAAERHVPILVLGGGSNIIVRDGGFPGLVLLNHLEGFHVLSETSDGAVIRIGAGEKWDDVVERSVKKHLSGIEALSAIPGSAGATPVQNVGAYGQEIADTFIELEAYDLQTNDFVILKKADCGFGYRTSIFKPLDNRRYIITSITLGLFKDSPTPPFYPRLQKYLDEHKITEYTPHNIREAVIAIRARILPDPQKIPNTGSFFKNPIVGHWFVDEMKPHYPNMPYFEMPSGEVKIPAGWLLETAGLKGYSDYGMRTYDQNALVFINENAHSYSDLATFRDEIINIVQQKFHIRLEQEPELI